MSGRRSIKAARRRAISRAPHAEITEADLDAVLDAVPMLAAVASAAAPARDPQAAARAAAEGLVCDYDDANERLLWRATTPGAEKILRNADT